MTTATDLALTDTQVAHARGIITAVKRHGLPSSAAVIAIETALAESGLRMYANANNARSLRLPHDAVGSDHGSVGLFQQQVGGAPNSTANWGTTDELMNAEISCGKFLGALQKTNWQHVTRWHACQDVQHSAYDGRPRKANNFNSEYGGNYHAQDAHADPDRAHPLGRNAGRATARHPSSTGWTSSPTRASTARRPVRPRPEPSSRAPITSSASAWVA